LSGIDSGSTTLNASAPGYSSANALAVDVVQPQLRFDRLGNTAVGVSTDFYLNLVVPGATYPTLQTAVMPVSVSLQSSANTVASVPAQITIPAGTNTSAAVPLTGLAVGSTTITASSPDLVPAVSASVTVAP
jgi:hypothetical protein